MAGRATGTRARGRYGQHRRRYRGAHVAGGDETGAEVIDRSLTLAWPSGRVRPTRSALPPDWGAETG
jgi:hypothetical protein